MLKRVLVSGLLSLFGIGIATSAVAQVQVHGFLLARTVAAQDNYAERIDRFGIQFAQVIDPEFDWVVETYIHPTQTTSLPGRLYLESAYLNWHLKDKLPWDFNVRIGKGRNFTYGITPTYGNRHTSDYSLYSEAFTQVRVMGFQTFSNFGNFQIAAAVLNPNLLASRPVPDFPLDNTGFINIPIADRDNDTGAVIRSAAFSGRAGYKTTVSNVGASVYHAKYGQDDLGGVEVKNSVNRWGLDGELHLENGLLLQGQFTLAQTPVDLDANGTRETTLDHSGFEFLGGYEKDKFGLVARYGQLDYDNKFQGLNQTMISAVYKIRPTVHFRLEGLINGEQTDHGFTKVDNDVLFFETLFAW